MAGKKEKDMMSLEDLETELSSDTKVKLAGLDVDGTRPLQSACSFC
jgi:hypothetical protein